MKNKLNYAHFMMALGLGAIMPFTFSPYDQNWLAIPVLAFWLWLTLRGSSFWIGYGFGFGWFGFGAWWLAPTLHTFGHLPWVVAGFCVMLVGAVMALLPAIWAWLTVRVAGQTGWLLFSFPLAAVATEWLRGHIFTGLPWTALGNLTLNTPAIGWAAWFGVYAMALLPALAAVSLILLLRQGSRGWGGLGLLATTLLVVLAPSPEQGEGVRYQATLVQANIPQDRKWDAAFVNETMFRYAALSSPAESDIIIWPEAAVPFFLSRTPGWDAWLGDQVATWQRPLLFGGLKLTGNNTANNGLFVHDAKVPDREFAGKQHLVPFGEYVPSWIPFLHALVPEIADFRPAEDDGVVKARSLHYGALICYESLFPEQARSRVKHGAQVLVNVTNDAWYGTTPAAWQHFQAARMRAVETGRYVLRAANTGVTAIIQPDGKVISSLPWWTQAALKGEFQVSDSHTRYVQWGDWPLLVCLFLLVIPLLRERSVYE